ncbi:MAG: PmoA family protein [Terriglobia bacterium]
MIRKTYLLLAVLVLACQASFTAKVQFSRHKDEISIQVNGRPFAIYHFDPAVAKPYLSPIRAADGIIVTRRWPMDPHIPGEDHDHPHQRALYFAHGDINGLDFWGEAVFAKPGGPPHPYGRTTFRKLERMKDGELEAEFDLIGPNGKAMGAETQSYRFGGGRTTRMIDCTFTLTADHGPLEIRDTKEGTFAIRVAKFLDSPPGHMVSSTGGVGEPQIWGKRADWVDYDGHTHHTTLGIAIFDSPRNFRHPTYWMARGYGLFAVNPFGIRAFTGDPHKDGSVTVPAGRSLTLRYRVLIHEGNYLQAHVAQAYEHYAQAEK